MIFTKIHLNLLPNLMWIFYTLKNLFYKNRFIIIFKKFINKLKRKDPNVNTKWLIKNCSSWEEYLMLFDPILYKETKNYVTQITKENELKLKHLDVKLGGSANLFLLFFLVRKLKPEIVLETGVAAGHSSKAILEAMKINQSGRLFSSDFPYFRLKHSEKYIGMLVDEDLKNNWTLSIEGDSVNIPKFLNKIDNIDIFHYDSDKSYEGKKLTFNLVKRKMKKGSIFIFDDIQDDNFFKDIVEELTHEFKVFKYYNKYIGLILF